MSRRVHHILLSLCIGGFLIGPTLTDAQQESSTTWIDDFNEAQNIAATTNPAKHLLVLFSAAYGCPQCDDWNARILLQESFIKQASEHYVLVKLDYSKNISLDAEILLADMHERGLDINCARIKQAYNINSNEIPVLMVTEGDGTVYGKLPYSAESQTITYYLDTLYKMRKRYDSYLSKYKKAAHRDDLGEWVIDDVAMADSALAEIRANGVAVFSLPPYDQFAQAIYAANQAAAKPDAAITALYNYEQGIQDLNQIYDFQALSTTEPDKLLQALSTVNRILTQSLSDVHRLELLTFYRQKLILLLLSSNSTPANMDYTKMLSDGWNDIIQRVHDYEKKHPSNNVPTELQQILNCEFLARFYLLSTQQIGDVQELTTLGQRLIALVPSSDIANQARRILQPLQAMQPR